MPEGLVLAEVAWLTDRLPTHGHLIPNGHQEPDDSVLGLAISGRAFTGAAGLPDGWSCGDP